MPDKRTVVCISDIHMSNGLPGAKPSEEGRTDRLDDQVALWDHVAQTERERGIMDTLIVGDLFDKARPDPVTLATTARCLVKLPGRKHILPGNHDCISHRGGRFVVEVFGAVRKKGLHSLAMGGQVELSEPCDWLAFHALPFMPIEETRAALKKLRKTLDKSVFNVLLFHNSILGCDHLAWKCDDGLDANEVCRGFDQVIAGHFHEHQHFGPDERGLYLSAPMHHSLQDVGRAAGYWIWTYEKGKPPVGEFVDPGLPKFHSMATDGRNLVVPPAAKKGDYIRMVVSATHADWIALKPSVTETVACMNRAGFRADFKHKPLLSTKKRFDGEEAKPAPAIPMEKHVKWYLKRVGAGELDPKKLAALGLDILAEARAEEG